MKSLKDFVAESIFDSLDKVPLDDVAAAAVAGEIWDVIKESIPGIKPDDPMPEGYVSVNIDRGIVVFNPAAQPDMYQDLSLDYNKDLDSIFKKYGIKSILTPRICRAGLSVIFSTNASLDAIYLGTDGLVAKSLGLCVKSGVNVSIKKIHAKQVYIYKFNKDSRSGKLTIDYAEFVPISARAGARLYSAKDVMDNTVIKKIDGLKAIELNDCYGNALDDNDVAAMLDDAAKAGELVGGIIGSAMANKKISLIIKQKYDSQNSLFTFAGSSRKSSDWVEK